MIGFGQYGKERKRASKDLHEEDIEEHNRCDREYSQK